MTTAYPGALDDFPNPSAGDNDTSPSHAGQHSNANDAIEAIQHKLGIGTSLPAAGTVLRGTAAGVSGWGTFDAAAVGAQPLDPDLTAIAALAPANDSIIQRKGGAWVSRTMAELTADLGLAGGVFQPLDDDLTAIAALATTPYGRALLTATDGAALLALINAGTQNLWIPAFEMWPTITDGCSGPYQTETATNKLNRWALDFSDGQTTYAEFAKAMPADWDGGTLTARFHWYCLSAVSTSVVWQLQAVALGDGDVYDAAQGTLRAVNDAMGGAAGRMLVSNPTAAITVAGTPAAGEYVHFRVGRWGTNGSDTMTQVAHLAGVTVTYGRA